MENFLGHPVYSVTIQLSFNLIQLVYKRSIEKQEWVSVSDLNV